MEQETIQKTGHGQGPAVFGMILSSIGLLFAFLTQGWACALPAILGIFFAFLGLSEAKRDNGPTGVGTISVLISLLFLLGIGYIYLYQNPNSPVLKKKAKQEKQAAQTGQDEQETENTESEPVETEETEESDTTEAADTAVIM
jgi:thiol:disulfide interchange protein